MGPWEIQWGRAVPLGALRVPHTKAGSQNHAVGADWTPVAGDVSVIKDGGTPANIGTLPAATAVGNGALWQYVLTAAETQAKRIELYLADAAAKAVEDDYIILTTVDHPLANDPRGCVHYGVVAGGGASSVTLTGGVSYLANKYRGMVLRLKHGGLTVAGGLAIDATATKFKTTATLSYVKAGLPGTKVATTAIVFSAAHTVNNAQAAGTYWGCIMVQYDGTNFSTKVPAADQVYASEALALAAVRGTTTAPGLTPDAGCFPIGYITINSKANLKWTANTDNMTAASGVTNAFFYDGYLVGGEEEYKEVASYVESTGVATAVRAWDIVPQQSVDELWVLGVPYAGTATEFIDALLARSTKGGSNPATGNFETVGECIAAGGAGKVTDNLAGTVTVKHGDGTTIGTRSVTRSAGQNPLTSLA